MSSKNPYKIAKSREKTKTVIFDVADYNWSVKKKLPLYTLVYKTQVSLLVACFLVFSFLIQGIPLARASEISESPPESNAITTESETDTVGDFDVLVDDAEELQNEITVADIFAEDDSESELPSTQDDLVAEVNDSTTSVDEVDESSNPSETVSEEDAAEEEDEEIIADDEELEEEPKGELLDDEADDIFITEENATSTEVVSEVVAVAYSDNSFSFNEDECTVLASGSFYCNKANPNTLKDALFAAPDIDGDLEIYLVREGLETQVTHNQTDDAAPFYDKNSNTIVWHRLINDRYQIVSYDIENGEEEVLTDTSENNMEPNRQGKYTVWQRWIGGGWNIVLSDGRNETQLTKTTSHNVAPYIHGNLVVWNRHDQVNERTIEMYDMSTETYVSIEDPEGMSVSNPRMVFVYDSIQSNGDIVTKGYDLLAKKFIDLDTLPRELPEELPDTDTTGETRALLQGKTGGKSEIEEVTETDGGVATSTDSTPTTVSVVSTSTVETVVTELTLDLTEPTVASAPEITEPADLDLSAPVDDDLSEDLSVVEFVMPPLQVGNTPKSAI